VTLPLLLAADKLTEPVVLLLCVEIGPVAIDPELLVINTFPASYPKPVRLLASIVTPLVLPDAPILARNSPT